MQRAWGRLLDGDRQSSCRVVVLGSFLHGLVQARGSGFSGSALNLYVYELYDYTYKHMDR